MNGAYPIGGRSGGDRLEAELRVWLRNFDPGELPIDARIRAYRGLETASWSPQRVWMRYAKLGLAATSFAIIGLAVLFALWVGSRVGSPPVGALPISRDITPFTPDFTSPGPDLFPQFLLVAIGVIAGIVSALPIVHRGVGWLVRAKAPAPLSYPLPLPRNWHSVSPLAWVLAIGATALAIGNLVSLPGYMATLSAEVGPIDPAYQARLIVSETLGGVGLVLVSIAAPLRYRLKDLSDRLLLGGMLAPIVERLLVQVVIWLNLVWSPGLGLAITLLSAATPLLTALGLAKLVGPIRHPNTALAALGVAAAFAFGFEATAYIPAALPDNAFLFGINSVGLVGWLALLWIGWSSLRNSSRRWPWWLLVIAGASALLALLPNMAEDQLAVWSIWLPDWFAALTQWWSYVMRPLSLLCLGLAVLGGLVPAGSSGRVGSRTE